ncbi:MAG: nitroreductase family protein [Nanoarchaeota archaeon]|nr:nitroreductase family protein [Nanoarchaeota archaeon]
MDLDKAIKTRKSVRRYSNKKPDWRDIIKAIDFVRFAPMAGNTFSMKFILVSDKEKIRELQEACQQSFVSQAQYVVVAVSNDSKTIMSYGDDFGKKFSRQQAGAAIQNLLLKLNSMGLATCWVGYFSEEQIKRALKISDKMIVEAIFPIGYETKVKESRKSKPDLENVIFFDEYGNKMMEPKTKVKMEHA